MSRHALAALCVAAAVPFVAACGNDAKSGSSTVAAPATTAPAAKTKISSELLGTWKASVPLSEIRDLQPGPGHPLGPNWEIQILKDGGPGDAPALVYVNRAGDVRGAYPYRVVGDRIAVTDDNCSSGPVKNVYSFVVNGRTLTFKKVKNPCSDRVFEDLLTARPWRRG